MEVEELGALEEWLSQYGEGTQNTYRLLFKKFLEYTKSTPEELVKIYKEAEDKRKWSKDYGAILLRFQEYLLKEGMKPNGVYTTVTCVRSFFSRMCQPLSIRRGGVIQQQMAKGEHVFSQSDLQKMYSIADLRDKAIISTAVALGWSSKDFLNLERDFIEKLVKRAKDQGENFIRFDWERGKTKAPVMGILTPEALNDLEKWLKYSEKYNSKWLWSGSRNKKIWRDVLTDMLNRLSEKADLSLTGKLRFHLFRKFLMNTLAVSGLNEFETKIILGKKIPISDLTYLQLKESAYKKYKEAYPNFSLTKIVNERIPKLQETVVDQQKEIEILKTKVEVLTKTNETLMKRLEQSRNPELRQIATELREFRLKVESEEE